MPTTTAIAQELRRVADLLGKAPDVEVTKPRLSFYHGSGTKTEFINLAKVFPRPFDKGDGYQHEEYTMTHKDNALEVYATIDRSQVCILVEEARPARYECVPLLSQEEEATLGTF